MSAFYAVAKGKTIGIFSTWTECQEQVSGFKGAVFKKFSTRTEAEEFIQGRGKPNIPVTSQPVPNENPQVQIMGNVIGASGSNLTRSVVASSTRGPMVVVAPNLVKIPKIPQVSPTFDVRREVHSAKKELLRLKDKLALHPSSEPNTCLNKIGLKLDRILAYLDSQSNEVKSEDNGNEEDVPVWKKRRTDMENYQLKEGMRTNTVVDERGFHRDDDGFVHVYTDGACSENGKGSRSKAGIGVWWADDHPLNLAEPVQGAKATNNTAEIQAAIRAIETAIDNSITKLWVQTDSMFLINCITKWIDGWKRKGWKTSKSEPVINKDDLLRLDSLLNNNKNLVVRWGYVTAHRGVHGNEAADSLARTGAREFTRRKQAVKS